MEKRVKKWLKTIGWIVLIPILCVSLLVALLYLPPFQDFVMRKVSKSVSEAVGMDIHFGKFSLSYPLNLSAQDVYVMDADRDTIAYIKELNVKVRPVPLLHKDISISLFVLNEARIHSHTLIEGISVQGVIGSLTGETESISLINEEAIINRLKLSDTDLTVRIDSFPQSDTVQTVINWKVLLEDLRLERLTFSFQLPADTLSVVSTLENAALADANIDLQEARYGIGTLWFTDATLHYDTGYQPVQQGFDPSHIFLSELNACMDSILYQGQDLKVFVESLAANERSGLAITQMTTQIQMTESQIVIPRFTAKTPYSSISAQLTIPREMPETDPSGYLFAQLTATLAQRDLKTIMGELPNQFAGLPTGKSLSLSCLIDGQWNNLNLQQFKSEYPGIFQIDASGVIQNMMDSVLRSGSIDLTATIQGKELLAGIVPAQYAGRFAVPDTMRINMLAALQEGHYATDIVLSESQGKIELSGTYNPSHDNYFVDFKTDNISPIHFLPQDSLLSLTASLRAEGQGFDVFSAQTGARISGVLTHLQYKDMSLSGISFDGSLQNNNFQGTVASMFPYIKGNMTLEGNLQKDRLTGMLILDMDSLDLYGMKITEQPFSNAFQIFSEFESDLNKQHQLDITLGNWDMFLSDKTVSPKTLILSANANEDTTQISMYAGDLSVIFTAGADFVTISDKLAVVADELTKQMSQDSLINFQQLRPLFPLTNVKIEAQRENPVYNYLQNNNIYFDSFQVNASTSPEDGLKMDGILLSLVNDTTKIDTIRLDVRQDTTAINYTFDVVKNRFRRQEAYYIGLKGSLQNNIGDVEMTYRDELGDIGLLAGIRAEKQRDGVNFEMFPENLILAYQPFKVNENNYINVKNLKDISADLRLTGENNTSLWIHSLEEDGKMRELMTEINSIDLNRFTTNFSLLPSLQGLAEMSFRYVPDENTFMIVANANVNNLVYQGGKVGDLLLNGVYLPLGKDEHQLDVNLFHNDREVSTLTALYQPAKNDRIDGALDIHSFALSTLNPFFSGIANLNGAFYGSMTLSGTAGQPLLNGTMKLDTASIYSIATGSRFRFDEKAAEINNNILQFDRYGIYAVGNNPLVVDGTVNINTTDPFKSMADLRMNATNMQLLDSRKTNENIVFGRLFVDLRNFTAKGPISSLVVRGNLNLLGNTNMTCIMKETPLSTQDRMANLVTFTYFKDTIPRRRTIAGERFIRESRSVEGMDLSLSIRVEPAVKLAVELDEEGSNRIELEGGGNLSFQYTPLEEMILRGRYSFTGGLIKYNMPVIANKTLRIKENSYLDWSGDPFDPYLNLKATERIRTNVSTEDGRSSHSVSFDAGIELKQRMENLSLQFTLDALDDASVQNQLLALGAEERNKRAIGLLLTGLYLDEDKTGRIKFDMGSALNSFLQSEVNQLTGDLLKGVDFNFGMENYERMGMEGTNYSFRFAKRFYNDRLNIVLGGNVSTGNIPNDNNTFINDASIEYRLDPGGSRYAKLFYLRQYESLLEGEITKYGGGVVFRRKIRRLGDLFLFNRRIPNRIVETNMDNK